MRGRVPIAEVSALHFLADAEFAGGFLGDEADRPPFRILAEQRALRSTQHLDPIDLVQLQRYRGLPAVKHIVDVDRHWIFIGHIDTVRIDETTHRNFQHRGISSKRLDAQGGYLSAHEVAEAADIAPLELSAAQCVRRHDDLRETAAAPAVRSRRIAGRLIGEGPGAAAQCQRDCRR